MQTDDARVLTRAMELWPFFRIEHRTLYGNSTTLRILPSGRVFAVHLVFFQVLVAVETATDANFFVVDPAYNATFVQCGCDPE